MTDFVCVLDGERVAIRHASSIHIVTRADIVCVKSGDKYTWIVTTCGEYKARETLATVADALAPLGLVRIHRGIAINGARVQYVVGRGRHRLTITLDTGLCFDVGREYQPEIRARFGFRTRARLIDAVS